MPSPSELLKSLVDDAFTTSTTTLDETRKLYETIVLAVTQEDITISQRLQYMEICFEHCKSLVKLYALSVIAIKLAIKYADHCDAQDTGRN